ncbi:MAG TPA: zf-HC2 domain-containing protein [Thermoanaerobaculia bacterium]|nr:zf-HC2 domain-containing protein [Thermoanaerobaculia bacterium]
MPRSDTFAPDTPSSHLDDETVRRFRARSLGPDELIEASRHLQSCADCRSRMESKAISVAAARALRRQLSNGEGAAGHLDFESALMPYVENALSQSERDTAERHLAECAVCRRELDDLASFRRAFEANANAAPIAAMRPRRSVGPRRSGTRWLVAAAAVAAFIAGGIIVWRSRPATTAHQTTPGTASASVPLVAIVHDANGIVGLDAAGRLRGTSISAPWSMLVVAALRNPDLAVPPEVAALASPAVQVRGASSKSVVSLIEPVGIVVATTQPLLRWSSTLTRATYRVAVFDADMHPVVRAAVRSDSWQVSAPLVPGRTYFWEVSTVVNGEPVAAPGPDEPQSRFTVLRRDLADAIAAAHARGEGHLVLGVLLQSGGALDDARRELQALADANPDSSIARRLLASVQRR